LNAGPSHWVNQERKRGGIANQKEILPTDWKREKKSQKYTSAPQINKIAISTYIHIHYMWLIMGGILYVTHWQPKVWTHPAILIITIFFHIL